MPASQKPKLRKDIAFIFIGTALVSIIGVPLYGYFNGGYSPALWALFVLFVLWNGMSITAGYHRLWSHKSYQAHPVIRFMFALGGALSVQNSIKTWCSNHRTHHQHTDNNELDPYSAGKGLWYSHIGWMLRDYQAAETDLKNVKDLERDWVVNWQHDYYWTLAITINIVVPLAIGALLGDAWGGLLLLGFLRLVFCHHTTFFINSLAHFWGNQPYSDSHSAKDNPIVALLTYGEGYHNYHHTFQWDYRNGIRWYHFDPTKWLIATLSWLKLTSNLKVVIPEKIEQALAQMQLKNASSKVSGFNTVNTEKWLILLEEEYEQLISSLNEWSVCRNQWLELQKASLVKKLEDNELFHRLKQLEADLDLRRQQWRMLTQQFA